MILSWFKMILICLRFIGLLFWNLFHFFGILHNGAPFSSLWSFLIGATGVTYQTTIARYITRYCHPPSFPWTRFCTTSLKLSHHDPAVNLILIDSQALGIPRGIDITRSFHIPVTVISAHHALYISGCCPVSHFFFPFFIPARFDLCFLLYAE